VLTPIEISCRGSCKQLRSSTTTGIESATERLYSHSAFDQKKEISALSKNSSGGSSIGKVPHDEREEVPPMASLYERRGGLDAINSAVDSFVERCAGDERISDQVCEAVGGPCTPLPETYQSAPAPT
jgi:hypothetical protein